jgi:hypothetical protein
MTSSLKSRLTDLAAAFADEVISALQGSSLHELIGTKEDGGFGNGRPLRSAGRQASSAAAGPQPKASRSSGRLPRRSPEEIAKALDRMVTLLKKHKDGLRAEEIRTNLGMEPKEMPRILKEGVSTKKLSSKGQKRATTYFAK